MFFIGSESHPSRGGVEFGYSIGVDHGNGYSYQTRTGFDFSGGKWKSIACQWRTKTSSPL